MRLRIVTPLSVIVDEENVHAVRAEDASGGFGILPHHADFLTSLTISVVGWKRGDGTLAYCAVRHGVFTISGGQDITVATREAILGDDLTTLDQTVLARFRSDAEMEKAEHVESTRLQVYPIGQIMLHLQSNGRSKPGMFT